MSLVNFVDWSRRSASTRPTPSCERPPHSYHPLPGSLGARVDTSHREGLGWGCLAPSERATPHRELFISMELPPFGLKPNLP